MHCLCLYRHSDYKVVSPALRAVGNIVTGDDIQTQVEAHILWISLSLITSVRNHVQNLVSSEVLCVFVIVGNLELFSATVFTPSPQQSQGVHQEGGVLDCV